jgi:hypothetical protein
MQWLIAVLVPVGRPAAFARVAGADLGNVLISGELEHIGAMTAPVP